MQANVLTLTITEILASKKKKYTELARQINQTKTDIDTSRVKLDRIKEDRESAGPTYNEDGDIVISEDEFLEIKRLKDLKQAYRTDFDELKNLKAEVQYCQKLVDQCRQRLIQGKIKLFESGGFIYAALMESFLFTTSNKKEILKIFIH